jgi:hypothetical protein
MDSTARGGLHISKILFLVHYGFALERFAANPMI